MDTEPKYRWKVEGLEGYENVFGNGFLYTSLSAPVEADEYEHMKQRAEASERKLAVVLEACAAAVLQSGKFQTELVEAQRKYADLQAEHAHLASMCAAAVAEGNALRGQLATSNEPDWAKSPSLAKWWAVDEDGTARWYWSEPTMGKHGWFVRGNSAHLVATSQLAGQVELNGRDWWDTLRQKPQPRV